MAIVSNVNEKSEVFIIAEVAQAHDGSIGILHSYIDAVARTDVDAIKFQTHIADAESSQFEPFRVNFSYEDNTRFDYWKRMEFSLNQWIDIKQHCADVGLIFMSSPFSIAAVDLLEKTGIEKYKIGSGEITNLLLLEKVAKTGKEIICSTGMSSFQELDRVMSFLESYDNKISLLQCTTKYPAMPDEIGLNVINDIKRRYDCSVGLSDHSGTIFPSIAAVALGAKIIEVHVAFDKMMFGPDSTSSLTLHELSQMVEGVRFIETSLKCVVDKNDDSRFFELKTMFGKSLAVSRKLKKGNVITFDDLEAKKPSGKGIPAQQFKYVIGKKLKFDKNKFDFLNETDLL